MWRRCGGCGAGTPQDVAAELASQHGEPTTKVWFLVRVLQDYIVKQPHIRVALRGDEKREVRPQPCMSLHTTPGCVPVTLSSLLARIPILLLPHFAQMSSTRAMHDCGVVLHGRR